MFARPVVNVTQRVRERVGQDVAIRSYPHDKSFGTYSPRILPLPKCTSRRRQKDSSAPLSMQVTASQVFFSPDRSVPEA
jgi:hypothetical protein